MSDTQPRASLYFEPELNKKIDAECQRTGLSKNKLLVKIIKEYFEGNVYFVSDLIPEYQVILKEKDEDKKIKMILGELKALRGEIENLN